MVEVSDIVDEESLRAWLDARPKETRQADAVAISSRAAMRVMPVYVSRLGRGNWERQVLAKALPLLRSLLTSKATVKFPTQELRHASLLAADATREDNESTTINYSAAAATASAFGASPGFNSSVSAASVFYACSITSGIWEHVISDATMVTTGKFPSDSKLWIGGTSLQVETDWKAACQWLSVNPGHDFWIRWYEAALEGRPLTGDWDSHWQMLRDIALIPSEDWEQGAEHVAGLISEIEANYRPKPPVPSQSTTLDVSSAQIQSSLRVNRLTLPPTFEAVLGHLELEILRLQGINHWVSEEQQEQSRDLVRRLLAMSDAIGTLKAQAEAMTPEPTVEDAEETKKLWQEYLIFGRAWPRDNAPEIVDSAWRGGLIGLTFGGLTLCGMAATPALGVAGLLFGTKKLVEAAKAVKVIAPVVSPTSEPES